MRSYGMNWCCAAIAILVLLVSDVALAESKAQFIGNLVLRALPDGRNMELVEQFGYTDSHGVAWPVPSGTRVDGASIPRIFWSLIGAPFTGKFREASIIHDYYCQVRSRHWKAVHRVFLNGMMTRGVDKSRATLMYLAVYRFGPRWNFDVDACYCKGCPVCATPKIMRVEQYRPKYNEADFRELREKLKSGKLTVEQLEDAADYQLFSDILADR